MGKTVSCQKVTFDWSMGKTSGFLINCKTLLKLKCRDLKSADIKEAIADQLLPDVSEEVKTALLEYIQDNQSGVLLVLDGLDEIKQGIDLTPLIQGKRLPKCRLLLTSRDNPKLRQHCDTLFQIIGFSPQHARDFIIKYFGEDKDTAQKLLDKIPDPENLEEFRALQNSTGRKDGGFLMELISSPLNTALLCAVVEDMKGQLPSSATQLYLEIAACVLTRYYKKNGKEPPVDPMATHSEDLAALGRLALKGIENDRLHFDEDEFRAESRATNILEFGFLSKEASTSRRRPVSTYQFLHKTFQEFFAALSLSEQLLSGDTACLPSLLQGKYKQVTLFVVGLLSQKPEAAKQIVVDLMSSLTQSVDSSDNRGSFVYVCNVVRECGDNADLERAVCRSVVQHFTWRELELMGCNLSESSVELRVVCEALKENRPLEGLYLWDNKIKDVTSLAQSMESNRTLKVLQLSRNPFTDVSALTQSLRLNSTLERLVLDEKFRGESAAKKLEKQNPRLKIKYVG